MSNKQRLDFAIIGGGIGGLCLGLALHQRGVAVHIYEAANRFGEIGAGVSFTPNAVQAMHICHPGIYQTFDKVCTRNMWLSKEKVWLEYYDGRKAGERDGGSHSEFSFTTALGQNAVHRAHFLAELVDLFPSHLVSFGKRLEHYSEEEGGDLNLRFVDGTMATARAIIGCDGIKSHVRSSMFGADHPCANPSYTHKYAYRALVPMEDAIAAVGEEKAGNACAYLGRDQHLLTFAIDHDKVFNMAGFHTDSNNWDDTTHLTAPAHREYALRDFSEFGSDVTKLLHLAEPDLDVWAIFDLGENPPPSFSQGRVCLLGDAAHGTSPHHGAGAGMCIEDAAILAELLADEKVRNYGDVEKAFAVYDEVRRPRGEFLVQSSRFIGECYELRMPGVNTFADVESELQRRNAIIHNVDVPQMCKDARVKLAARVK